MIEPERLIASANEIDNRIGPIAGRSADRIAVELRRAAALIIELQGATGWRPRSTAPTDGTKFLGVTKSGRMKVDWLDDSLHTSQFAHERGDDGYTHWMPVPEAPKQSRGQ